MPYTAPTAADLKARFPAFNAVPDANIDAALAEAARKVDDTWAEGDFATARMLYAAHVLTLDGLGSGREGKLMGFRRIKVGPLELERSQESGEAGSLKATSFGVRFLELQRLNFAGGTVTS